ncbi:hypothetical protein MUB15_12550 [Priestia sp. OVS21]|nr:hypothetical protein [Priestia sp. OVS21]
MKKPFNFYIDDNSLEKLNEELIWKPTRKQKHKQRLLETIDQLESSPPKSKRNLFSIKQNHLVRNIVYCGITLFLLSGAFISSAFVSPAMAQVAAKIPYVGQLFKQKPIADVLYQELEKRDIKQLAWGRPIMEEKRISCISRRVGEVF